MTKRSNTHKPTKPSNRFSHGLASRAAADARVQAATELAAEMIGTAPATRTVWPAALAAADAILHYHAVQIARHRLLGGSTIDAEPEGDESASTISTQPGASEDSRANSGEDPGLALALTLVEVHKRSLAGLDEYARKSLSRRRKLIIRLDYELHELLRSSDAD